MLRSPAKIELIFMIVIIVHAMCPIACQSNAHPKRLIHVSIAVSRVISNYEIQLWFVFAKVFSLIPSMSESLVILPSWNKTLLEYMRPTDYLGDSRVPSTLTGKNVQFFQPLQQTQYNCQEDRITLADTKTTQSFPSGSPSEHTYQPSYNLFPEESQEYIQSTPKFDRRLKSFVQPCFDPLEAIHVNAVIYSTARIPCTVYNIDFQSTVMSWWKDGSLRELTVGNEVSNPRYELDRSNPRSWTLVINNVTQADAGDYICQINLSKLREKFYRLKITEPKTSKGTTKLDDGYVKDEAIILANSVNQDVTVKSDPIGVPGKPHKLTCLAHFRAFDASAGIQWFLRDRKIYPLTEIEDGNIQTRNSAQPSTSIRLSSVTGQIIDVTNRWINNHTLYSVLRISKLTAECFGQWKCKKYTRKKFEPLAESTFTLTAEEYNQSRSLNNVGMKQPRFISNEKNNAYRTASGAPLSFLILSIYICFPVRWFLSIFMVRILYILLQCIDNTDQQIPLTNAKISA
ncbi:hypothetical protein FGIG_05487 [Fasciola gigantica]|uniref:Ig-like domain-containing protein n=1 Tax=Fasciola gigantica TaxID=46835 RepID=A0A504YUH2_FASGI|nr:hypothetical protein FGIG_05487 [Fasciola gigantica]